MADEAAELRVNVPEEQGLGVYSNLLAVWHTEHDFTLDFVQYGMPQPDESGKLVMPATVVARVKVPVSVIFSIARAIAENVSRYEDQFGKITPRPIDESPLYPPSEENGDDA
jgi:Protein of unknown function (DUF3467)